jgi:multicomponent Na+:H+ antiporter subunit D
MVIFAAEQMSIWLWVLLEIASFGTFVSFLKLGYFAFLRPGDTEASDPPYLMQVGMLGAAALCILIGIYPQILYTLLPYPVVYEAYAPVHVISALIVLGAAALFFIVFGRKFLEPHDARLKDFDVAYVAAGRGITMFAHSLLLLFGRIYLYAIDAIRMLFVIGKYAMGMENRDANWNAAVFAGVIVAFMVILMMGVGW